MSDVRTVAEWIERLRRRSLRVAAIGVLVLFIGFFVDRPQFFQSYLFAWLFCLGLALGSLALVLLHNLTGGAWGFAIRRLMEASLRTLPLLALLFVPVLLGVGHLYEWSHEEVVAADPVLRHKQPYLNLPFFVVRAAIYFAVWVGLARIVLGLNARNDRAPHPRYLRRLRVLSAPGLVLYVVTMSFAAFDWGMSLEPHWFSTIYGVIFIVGQALSTLCLAIVVAAALARFEPFARFLDRSHFHDLGNLTLAFVMLWAYVSFSQYLIIWSGNLPEETPYYLHRTREGWQAIALALVVFHFAVPFLLLLSRRTKRHAATLAGLALVILALRLVDLFWHVAPAFHHDGLHVSWLDLAAPLALGGLWFATFATMLKGRPLISLQDAKLHKRLEEAPQT